MAITQQLARIPATRLAACRRSVAGLNEVCSFEAPEEDYLDLDWWPSLLVCTWELMGIDERGLAVLRRAFDGDGEVNPAYREHPDAPLMHPITALEPYQVTEVADALRSMRPAAVHAAVPDDRDRAAVALGLAAREVAGDLASLIAEQHVRLGDFYVEAADRGLAAVLWWD